MRNVGNEGRLVEEPPSADRTAFQRDRDRVIHSKSFRRLGYKTQVFVNSEGDNYRTRLTHSIEVAQVSRSVATALRLNRDYAETIALAHDLGHTPFGHAGQDALHEEMKPFGGFEHNQQSLRIVAKLESRYIEFRGLNLSTAVLAGLLKHEKVYDCDVELHDVVAQRRGRRPPLEAAIVDHCDRIAYIHHDLEDGMDARILSLDELQTVPAWQEAYRKVETERGSAFVQARSQVRFRVVLRQLMNEAIRSLIETVRSNLAALEPEALSNVRQLPKESYPVRLAGESREVLASLQKLLFDRLYRNPRVMQMSQRGRRIIAGLFEAYRELPSMMPRHYQAEAQRDGLERVVADYVAGMTDRYALEQYRYIIGVHE